MLLHFPSKAHARQLQVQKALESGGREASCIEYKK
jgi:hypothetical protein